MIIQEREMIKARPSWGRSRLSKKLAIPWNWRGLSGQLKDMASRSFLLKLERWGYRTLPPPLSPYRKVGKRLPCSYAPYKTTLIASRLNRLLSLNIQVVKEKYLFMLFKCLFSSYHYLGFIGTVGENLKRLDFDEKNSSLPAFSLAPRP